MASTPREEAERAVITAAMHLQFEDQSCGKHFSCFGSLRLACKRLDDLRYEEKKAAKRKR